MPIITLQQRLVELGIIRTGHQVKASSGKMRPAALDCFRFTSDRKDLLERIAELHGGDVKPFEEPKSTHTWEVLTTSDTIEVLVPPPGPGRSVISQWYEKWSAGGCTHRCDGAEMLKCDGRDMPPGAPCQCAERGYAPDADEHCAAHTRLSVVIPDTGAIGVWRLNTQGWNAAEEFAGIAETVLNVATSLGYSVPCILSLQHREVRKLVDGQATTRKFVVPVLSPDLPQDVVRGVTAGRPYDPRSNQAGGGGPQAAEIMPPPSALPSGGVRADRYGTGRVKPKAIEVAVPPTDMPLPGGPLKPAGSARGLAFIRSLPESFQGDENRGRRHALYALATGKWGAEFGDLEGTHKARVQGWASSIEGGVATLNVGESGHSLTGTDGDAVSVTKP